jgi:hypothetical protein
MVPSGAGTAVELRTEQGRHSFAKQAPTITAARSEAEYLRLALLRDEAAPVTFGIEAASSPRAVRPVPAAACSGRVTTQTVQSHVMVVEDDKDTREGVKSNW